MACLRSLVIIAMVTFTMAMPSFAAVKTYEKPSSFITRHFGKIPKTQAISLSRAQQSELKKILGHSYAEKRVRYWEDGGKTAFILEEIGKTEPITTGFIIKGGKIVEIKVLIYRESHGWEVSRPFFTKQFVGAKLDGSKVDREIDGIVGATLSVRALTNLSAAALYLDQQT